MHSPSTLAFSVRIPISFKRDRYGDRKTFALFDIWHNDPCKGGHGDDSCGWFMRASHGNPENLKKIISDFKFEWNSSYQPWFTESGDPALSTMGIALGMFRYAAFEHFKKDRKKIDRYMRSHLYDILHFAENSCDTLATSIQVKYGKPNPKTLAAIVYGCVLRDTRPWWKHPRWHVHHWSIVIPSWIHFRRLFWDRCCECNKTLGWNKCVISKDWHGTQLVCYRCDGGKHIVDSTEQGKPATSP